MSSHGFNDLRGWPTRRKRRLDDAQILQLFDFEDDGTDRTSRRLKVTVSGTVLKLGHDRHIRGFRTEKEDFVVYGTSSYDAEADELVIAFDRLAASSSADGKSTGLTIPIRFHAGMEYAASENDHAAAESKLLSSAATRNPISFDRFLVPVSATCIYGRPSVERDLVTFDFRVDVVTLAATFEASPLVKPLPDVITTALAKGLVESAGNEFLHSRPKSGYVTANERNRLLLLLDSDPKVTVLALVGVWISGVHGLHHPFVWAACARYANARDLNCLSPMTFLLVVYDCITFRPSFYECVARLRATKPEPACATFVARAAGVVSTVEDTTESRTVVAYAVPKAQLRQELMMESDRDSTVTPRQRLSFAVSSNGAFPSTRKALESPQRVSDGMSPSTTDDPYCSIPTEVRRLLAAQEHQLNDLRRRVDDLTRDRSNGGSHERSQEEASSAAGSIATESTTPIVGKGVSSTATMTSFAFPPLRSSRTDDDDDDDHRVRCEGARDREPIEEEGYAERSVERSRETVQCSRWMGDGGESALTTFSSSLAELRLDSMLSEPSAVDWQRPSWPLVVDLPDHNFESLLSCRQLVPSRSSRYLENLPPLDGANPDGNFYGSLLRRIQTILSNQSTDDGQDRRGSDVGVTPSVFDSMFLPRLNYVSLRLDEDRFGNDRSARFEVLARKYLVGRCPDETDLSLDTLRYLRKFRLLH